MQAAPAPDKPYLAVCAIYRWEADYLREWVAFHRLVGVDRFFLYDNASQDAHLEALAPFIADGSVVLHDWQVFPGQRPAYDHCVAEHREDARWIAFIDCDEFLFSPTGRPVPEVLRSYERFAGVGVNRVWMGTSFHETRPAGLVIENFVHRLDVPDPNTSVKSIVDPTRVERVFNAHSFVYADGGHAVDENMVPVEGHTAASYTFERLRINHYFTKSEEEALAKFARPQAGTGALRPELSRNALRKRNERFAVPDDALLRYLPALKEGLARVERGEPFK